MTDLFDALLGGRAIRGERERERVWRGWKEKGGRERERGEYRGRNGGMMVLVQARRGMVGLREGETGNFSVKE